MRPARIRQPPAGHESADSAPYWSLHIRGLLLLFPVMASSFRVASLMAAAYLSVFACASGGMQNGVLRRGDVAFRAGPIPADWQQVDTDVVESDLAAAAFRDQHSGSTIGVAGRCGRDADDVPLRALTQHLYLGFTDRQMESEQHFYLDSREALRTQMTASVDGVPRQLVFVVLKKDGCVYDFWFISSSEGADTSEFDQFVQGFQTLD